MTALCRVVLGPPGTGKTRRTIDLVRKDLDEGVEPSQIGFVSYTRAAVTEARQRASTGLRLTDDETRWWGTLHSLGLRMVGGPSGGIWKDAETREFANEHKYRVEDVEDALHAIALARNLLDAPIRWLRRMRGSCLDAELLLKRWQGFKASRNLLDFEDMIEGAIHAQAFPRLRRMYVDEAQDLSPLQARLVDRWRARVDLVTVAGDDDQAIMQFQGADARWLQGLAREHGAEVLAQSWRIPRSIHRMADRIVRRIGDRVPKDYRARDEEGEVSWAGSHFDAAQVDRWRDDGSVACLAWRTVDLEPMRAELHRHGIPYRNDKGFDPLNPTSNTKALPAAQAAIRLRNGHPITRRQMSAILDAVKVKSAGLARGVKASAQRALEGDGACTEGEGSALGLSPIIDAIRATGCEALDLADGTAAFYSRVLGGDGSLPPDDRCVRLTTCHSSKGREWATVYLSSTMPLPAEQRMNEGGGEVHRVPYVAVTRAKHRLVLAASGGRREYPYPRGVAGDGEGVVPVG